MTLKVFGKFQLPPPPLSQEFSENFSFLPQHCLRLQHLPHRHHLQNHHCPTEISIIVLRWEKLRLNESALAKQISSDIRSIQNISYKRDWISDFSTTLYKYHILATYKKIQYNSQLSWILFNYKAAVRRVPMTSIAYFTNSLIAWERPKDNKCWPYFDLEIDGQDFYPIITFYIISQTHHWWIHLDKNYKISRENYQVWKTANFTQTTYNDGKRFS